MPLILVVTPGGVLAASMSDRAYYLGDPSDPVLERLTGVPLSAQVISRLLLPDVAPFEPGCDAHRGRYRRVEDFGRIATRLEVRCAAAGLRLSLDSPRIHLLDGRNPFALDPGPGFHATTLQDLTARIEDSLREAP